MNYISNITVVKLDRLVLKDLSFNSLTDTQKKIMLVASLAFTLLMTIVFLSCKYLKGKKKEKHHSPSDSKVAQLSDDVLKPKNNDTIEAKIVDPKKSATTKKPVVHPKKEANTSLIKTQNESDQKPSGSDQKGTQRQPQSEQKGDSDQKPSMKQAEPNSDILPQVDDKNSKEVASTNSVVDKKQDDQKTTHPSYIARIVLTAQHFGAGTASIHELRLAPNDERLSAWGDASGKPLTIPANDILIPIQLRKITDGEELKEEEYFWAGNLFYNFNKGKMVFDWIKSDTIWIPASLIDDKKPGETLELTYKGTLLSLKLHFNGSLELPFPQDFPLSVLTKHAKQAVDGSKFPNGLFTLSHSGVGRRAFEPSKAAIGYKWENDHLTEQKGDISAEVPCLSANYFLEHILPRNELPSSVKVVKIFASAPEGGAKKFGDVKWNILLDIPRVIREDIKLFVEGNYLIISLPIYSTQDISAQRHNKDYAANPVWKKIGDRARNQTLGNLADNKIQYEQFCKELRQKIETSESFHWPSTGPSKQEAIEILERFVKLLDKDTLLDDIASPLHDYMQLLDLLHQWAAKNTTAAEIEMHCQLYLKPFHKKEETRVPGSGFQPDEIIYSPSIAELLKKKIQLITLEMPKECLGHIKEISAGLANGQMGVSIPMDYLPPTDKDPAPTAKDPDVKQQDDLYDTKD